MDPRFVARVSAQCDFCGDDGVAGVRSDGGTVEINGTSLNAWVVGIGNLGAPASFRLRVRRQTTTAPAFVIRSPRRGADTTAVPPEAVLLGDGVHQTGKHSPRRDVHSTPPNQAAWGRHSGRTPPPSGKMYCI